LKNGDKHLGEYHLHKQNGCGKIEDNNGKSYWGDSRIVKDKDSVHLKVLMGPDISANSSKDAWMVMEYTDRKMGQYIRENKS
jgi:hypothetical protein